MTRIYAYSFMLLILSTGCHPKIQRGDAVVLESRSAGMFSVLDDVWSILDCYDTRYCSAVKVDFGTSGLYYDNKKGPNWFDYYFLPIDLGTPKGGYVRTSHPFEAGKIHPEFHALDKERIASLVHKYLRLRPEIEEKITKFTEDHFKDHFVIGIHYRGTDKSSEAPRTPYEKVAEEVSNQVHLRHLSDYKIFVATDEQGLIDYLEAKFPNKTIHLPGVERSKDGKPLHVDKKENQYETGRDALMDCIALSKTNLLIRTSSNLSRWSTYFNPKLPVIELSKRH